MGQISDVSESGSPDLGIPEEAGVLARKVPYARKVQPARKSRVCGRTCRRGKGVLRGRNCWCYMAIALLGIGI